MTTSMACPDCGSALMLSEATTFRDFVPPNPIRGKTELVRKPVETIVAACTGCEFVLELTGEARAAAVAELRGTR